MRVSVVKKKENRKRLQANMSEFTEDRKAEILSVSHKFTEEDREKFNAYHDIHHALMDACNCCIPESVPSGKGGFGEVSKEEDGGP
jgi:hypothetical protein